MRALGIGLVGAGSIGTYYHGPSYLKMRNVRIRGICDIDRRKARQAARYLEVREVYTGIEKILKNPEIDVVDICVPTPWHPEYTIKAAEGGKHVLCEKPIALNLKAADKMVKATREAGVKFMVAHVLRFDPAYATAKKIMDSGTIGMPLLALATRHSQLDPRATWYTDVKMSGGIVVEMHIHDLDYLNWVFGRPTNVCSQGSKSMKYCWEHVSSLATYSKHKGFAEASWWWRRANFPFSTRFSALCERGGVEIDVRGFPMRERLWVHSKGKDPILLKLPEKDGYANEIEYFVNCVRNDRDPTICRPEDAMLALESVLEARRSIGRN